MSLMSIYLLYHYKYLYYYSYIIYHINHLYEQISKCNNVSNDQIQLIHKMILSLKYIECNYNYYWYYYHKLYIYYVYKYLYFCFFHFHKNRFSLATNTTDRPTSCFHYNNMQHSIINKKK